MYFFTALNIGMILSQNVDLGREREIRRKGGREVDR